MQAGAREMTWSAVRVGARQCGEGPANVVPRGGVGTWPTRRMPATSSVNSRRRCGRMLRSNGLEQFDRVSGGILEKDLPTSDAGDDVVAKANPGPAQHV